VLDSRDTANFGNGAYWIWRISGRVLIRVTRTGGPSPVIAAVFLDPASASTPPPPCHPRSTLAADPSAVTAGQSATLTWTATNAASISIDQGIGAVAATGSRVVTPAATTTYTITAVNTAGQGQRRDGDGQRRGATGRSAATYREPTPPRRAIGATSTAPMDTR
jgi:hypothetical protein